MLEKVPSNMSSSPAISAPLLRTWSSNRLDYISNMQKKMTVKFDKPKHKIQLDTFTNAIIKQPIRNTTIREVAEESLFKDYSLSDAEIENESQDTQLTEMM